MTQMAMTRRPVFDVDLFSDAVIADSYPHYKALRDLGPAVWLPRHDCWAIARFADVRDALKNDAVFISGEGVMLNDPTNQMTRDSLICLCLLYTSPSPRD